MTHTNPSFTPLELQFVRSSLFCKTDREISDILEKPVDDIIEAINELMGSDITLRFDALKRVDQQNEQKLSAQKIKSMRKLESEEAKKEENRKKKVLRLNAEEKRKKDRESSNDRKKFKTKPVDTSQMIAVRIDRKTLVFVKPGTNIEKVKAQYQKTNTIAEL